MGRWLPLKRVLNVTVIAPLSVARPIWQGKNRWHSVMLFNVFIIIIMLFLVLSWPSLLLSLLSTIITSTFVIMVIVINRNTNDNDGDDNHQYHHYHNRYHYHLHRHNHHNHNHHFAFSVWLPKVCLFYASRLDNSPVSLLRFLSMLILNEFGTKSVIFAF